MRHRLKFSQNSYVRMRSWEQRGKTNGKRKRDLGQDAQREGAGGWEGEAWRKTPGGKQRVRGIRGQRDTGEGREEKYQRDREPAEEAGRDPQTPPPTAPHPSLYMRQTHGPIHGLHAVLNEARDRPSLCFQSWGRGKL